MLGPGVFKEFSTRVQGDTMRLSRTELIPVLTIIAGGAIGAITAAREVP